MAKGIQVTPRIQSDTDAGLAEYGANQIVEKSHSGEVMTPAEGPSIPSVSVLDAANAAERYQEPSVPVTSTMPMGSTGGTSSAATPVMTEERRAPVTGGMARKADDASVNARIAGLATAAKADDAIERIKREDAPIHPKTTRSDVFSQSDIDRARAIKKKIAEANQVSGDNATPVGQGGSVPDATAVLSDQTPGPEKEDVVDHKKDVKSSLKKSLIQAAARVKPSIMQRNVGTPKKHRQASLSYDNMPTKRPAPMGKRIKDRIAKQQFGKPGVGVRVYGKMIGMPTLSLNEIGIGFMEMMAIVDQNADMLDNLIKMYLSEEERANFTTVRMMNYGEVADFINDHYIEVFTAKAPNNRGQDLQRRRLVVLEYEQRGIFLHPTQAALYTADYDGDDMMISIDPSNAKNAKDPVEHMIGVDGELSLDTNMLMVSNLYDGWETDENGREKTARDYVTDVMLHKWSNTKMSDEQLDAYDDVIDKVMELSKTEFLGSDSQAKAWGDFFRSVRKFSDMIGGKRGRSNRIMSDITKSVYDGFRNFGIYGTILRTGEVVPRDTLPPAYTSDDRALYSLIDGMVLGAIPNNTQELKVFMNGFLGNVEGKSAPFRFTADVGKMFKLDSRFRIGKDYIIDPDNEDAMVDFLQSTIKYAYSERMTIDVKAAGKSYQYTEMLRRNVISEVGFPDATFGEGSRFAGEQCYENMADFLLTFAEAYNRNAAIINEANLVYHNNMQIASNSPRRTVNPIENVNNGKLRYKDLATPLIEVYGTYSFDRMFGRFVDYKEVDPFGPNSGRSNANKVEREWYRTANGRRWLKARYSEMSIKGFSIFNQIFLEDSDQGMIEEIVRFDDNEADVVDCMIAAIADKRRSTASTFNTRYTGRYDSKDGKRTSVETEWRHNEMTVVGRMKELLTDIYHADFEGTLLAPGYYAGIGTRDKDNLVPEFMDAATKLAKELAADGWVLRSGHANGSDLAFEAGAGGRANIYVPYKGFNGKTKVNGASINFDQIGKQDRTLAEDSVLRYHPNGRTIRDNYMRGAKIDPNDANQRQLRNNLMFPYEAMRRNYMQVVGTDGAQDSAFIACYDKGGGTSQAIRIAQDRGIPVFNAADYNGDYERWANDVKEAARKAWANQLYRETSKDQMLHVDNAIMALNATGYELFNDLDMDSTAGFLNSEYGRKLLEHYNDADVIASIRAAMVFAQNMKKIDRLYGELADASEKMFDDSADRGPSDYMHLTNQLGFAYDELSEKSPVWSGLISEMRADSDEQMAFVQLRTVAGRRGLYWKAPDFWSGEAISKYETIRDVIEDLDMPWPLKCDIITDVARWQTQDTGLQYFEVAYQLEVGSDSRFSLNGGAPTSPMQVYNESSDAYTSYAGKSIRNLRMEVKKAADMWRSTDGALTHVIHNLATHPQRMVHIEDTMYADAILAVRDKVYAQTEKSKKHPSTGAIYSAISLQRNGGYFNDVYRFDDRMLGLQHKSQISAADIIKMLDDPNYFISVYDDFGSIDYLNRQRIMGIDGNVTESDIWDWLIANPRIACALRAGTACVKPNTAADGYIGSRMSLSETIGTFAGMVAGGSDVMGDVKYLMRDHPVYAGIIALLTPAHGTSVRNERTRVPVIEETVCREIHSAAREGRRADSVMEALGIDRELLRNLMTSDFDKYMESMGFGFDEESIGEAHKEADDIYDTINSYFNKYIDEVAENVSLAYSLEVDDDGPTVKPAIDIESIASFWDTVQELSGAKVAVSTGVEGSETFRFSYWVSHMGAKDNYANLEAIANMIQGSKDPLAFNGMWTSKGPLSVRETDGGIVTNVSELVGMKESADEEIVTRVPDWFEVPDRSTDSFGKQVPSLYAAMVSKRSNGAEKFNLKAMKAGLDGLDSVTKMKGGKYLTEEYGGVEYPILYDNIRNRLVSVAMSSGIDSARMELANMMMEQDSVMGYKDMTLSNYMSIAEVMLVMDEETGVVLLRSLEQIVAAAKGRIGARVDEMTDEQVMNEIKEIMTDTSDESGVGNSIAIDPYEMLSEIKPRGRAVSPAPAIKLTSSVFKRNYDLLTELRENTQVEVLDAGERNALHQQVMNIGIEDVSDLWDRCDVVRDYSVIGLYGFSGSEKKSFVRDNIGPSSIVMIGSKGDKGRIKEICDRCWETGVSVLVSKDAISKVPDRFIADMIPASSHGDMLIPMFDARLNGSEAKPFEPRFSIFQAPFDRYVISVEDSLNVFELGDAQYKFTRNLTSRMKARDHGSVQMTAESLFPNVFKNREYKDATFKVGLASKQVVSDFICSEGGPTCTIDYGLVEGAKGWKQRVHDVNKAIRTYNDKINTMDDDGILRGVNRWAKPGEIVAWADLCIERRGHVEEHVLAPIIPFPLHTRKRVPEMFRVRNVGPVDGCGSLLSVDWDYEQDLNRGYIKYFDSSGGANKGLINLSDVIRDDMRLKNGMSVDAYCAAFSTDSRKIGTDRRIKTMISLMAIARMEGYNFARTEGAFPEDEELRQLADRRLPMSVWSKRYDNGFEHVKFSNDERLNAFLRYECKKIYDNGGNPSDYLACVFTGKDGSDYNSHVMWEFECMFDGSLNYEDSLLRFLHFMKPGFCPNGINDDTEDADFRLYRDSKNPLGSGFDRGMLQMKVPYPVSDYRGNPTGQNAYIWSNVFVGMSFFGEDCSMATRPNISGASDMLDGENTLSYYHVRLSDDKARMRGEWATSFEGRVHRDAGALGV